MCDNLSAYVQFWFTFQLTNVATIFVTSRKKGPRPKWTKTSRLEAQNIYKKFHISLKIILIRPVFRFLTLFFLQVGITALCLKKVS